MLKELTEPRERLIYAYALLRGVKGENDVEGDLLTDAMLIIDDVVQNTWITAKTKEVNKHE